MVWGADGIEWHKWGLAGAVIGLLLTALLWTLHFLLTKVTTRLEQVEALLHELIALLRRLGKKQD